MDMKKLAEVLKMVEVEILTNLVFVGHGVLHLNGAVWNKGHVLQY